MKPLRFLIVSAMITAVLAIVSTPSSAVEPGDVLINEVAPDETSSRDWLELYNGSGSNIDIQSWVVRQQTSKRKTFPSYTLAAGEYIVLHFHDKGTADEIGGDTNGNSCC
ncbi:MAG: lamin tail domain-containing protein [Anaerolineae bacterium]